MDQLSCHIYQLYIWPQQPVEITCNKVGCFNWQWYKTRIIVDDIVSHSKDMETSLLYMECQLCTCLAYHLSISLKKNFIFPQYFEFLGNDICPDGNSPSQSKHKLLSTWPHPEIVCNIAKFISFAWSYSVYIHYFELRITPLHATTITHEDTDAVAPIWTNKAQWVLEGGGVYTWVAMCKKCRIGLKIE